MPSALSRCNKHCTPLPVIIHIVTVYFKVTFHDFHGVLVKRRECAVRLQNIQGVDPHCFILNETKETFIVACVLCFQHKICSNVIWIQIIHTFAHINQNTRQATCSLTKAFILFQVRMRHNTEVHVVHQHQLLFLFQA